MLVSNETNHVQGGSRVMLDLISSCYEAQERFRSAAATSEDSNLKRLLEIYAQQRTRFAQELREHLPASALENGAFEFDFQCRANHQAGEDSLRNCLDTDSRSLSLYKQALASRDLPTRTHFLISSQLALLERAHERVTSLVQKPEPAVPGRMPTTSPPGARLRA
jgi:hypothetical protein